MGHEEMSVPLQKIYKTKNLIKSKGMKKVLFLFLAVTILGLVSCNSNDDENGIVIDGITITDDVDCCSAEEALQVYKFIQTVKIIPELSIEVDGKYNVWAYSKSGSFHTGYNEIFFVATKKLTGNYIKKFDIKNLTPLMHMVKMDMYHSSPASEGVESFNDGYLAVQRGWVSFVMPTSEAGDWVLSYDVEVLGSTAHLEKTSITVDALPEGQEWVKSFKANDKTYYVSIVNPADFQTGENAIQAYVSVQGKDRTVPYSKATETFTIEIDPRMPDMGNHTSPNNTPLVKQKDGSYQGNINLTMTGLWRIHLTVKDSKGNIVGGGDDLKDGLSSLYWDVTL